jgi:hypothetical protein
MENKQTAIEWLENNLEQYGSSSSLDLDWETLDELIEQAKAMEKEQHGKTWDSALSAYKARGGNVVRAIVDFDEYYNETYKK